MDLSNTGVAKFLIVDDSRAIQSIIKRVIESCNYPLLEIKTANDGEDAIKILEEFRPDLIITDWHMQKIGGLEFCQHVCQTYSKTIPIGFVTTESSPDKLEQAYSNGAKFVINKPFQDDDLKSILFKYVPIGQNSNHHSTLKRTHNLLADLFKGHEYTLEPSPTLNLSDFTNKNIIGLFGENGKTPPVNSLSIMDMNTMGLLWAIHNKQPKIYNDFIAAGEPSNEHLDHARSFMEEFGADMLIHHKNAPIKLARSSIVNRDFPRLGLSLNTNIGRDDYKLTVPSIGSGYISFIKLI